MQKLLSSLLGPMFAKEMVEIARRKRYFFNRVFYGAALLFALFLVWEEYSWQLYYAGSTRIQDMAEMAEVLFIAVAWVQYCAVYLFVPVFVCGVISTERESHTLDLLLTTQLSDREIVLGKLASRLAVTGLLILCAVPIICLVMMFGGVDPAAIVYTQAATLLAMIYSGAHAIYFSTISKSPIGAIVRTYWWMSVWLLGLPVGTILFINLFGNIRGPTDPLLYLVWVQAFVNPIVPFMSGAIPEFHQEIARVLGASYVPFTYIVPLVWSGFLMWRAVARLRLPPTLLFRMGDRFKPLAAARGEWRKFRFFTQSVRRIFAGMMLGVIPVRNALWLRARRANVYDREGHIGRIQWAGVAAAVFFVLMIMIGEPRELGHEECAMSFLSVTWIGVAALTVIVSASSLTSDRRLGFFELVLTTRLRPYEIIGGTLLAVWHHLRVAYCLAWGLTFFFVATGASDPIGALFSAITATFFCATIMVMGVLCSLTARNVASALVPTFAYPVVMLAVTALLIGVAEEASGPILWAMTIVFLFATAWWARRSTSAAANGCLFIAVHLALCCIATFWTFWDGDRAEYPICMMHPGFLTIVFLEDNLAREIDDVDLWFLSMMMYWAALELTVIWACGWMIHHFDRLVGRTLRQPDASPTPASRQCCRPFSLRPRLPNRIPSRYRT